MNNSKIVVAHLGARRHYAEARIFDEAGLLEHFFTDAYIGNKPLLNHFLSALPDKIKPPALQRLLSRNEESLKNEKITSFDLLGFWYINAIRKVKNQGELEKVYCEGARKFSDKIFKQGLKNCNLIWGYNGASLELFEFAKNKNIRCVLDQTSNPKPLEIKLTQEEFSRWKEWNSNNYQYIPELALEKRESEEWKLADAIVAGSSFVKSGLMECGVAENKIYIIPSGIDVNKFKAQPREPFHAKRPLRVLFVGRVSIMKGVPYLLEALKLLGPHLVEARFVGSISIKSEKLREYDDVANFVGMVSREKIPDQYGWADVFCFPSITEGSATVTYEALASGLPVITTPNSGSIVRDGMDGHLVAARNSGGLATALLAYIQNPALLAAHQKEAINGRTRLGLDRYKDNLIKLISHL